MIFTSEWWYCGVIELAIVAATIAAAVLLAGKRPLLDRAVTMVIGAYLIMYKSYELLPELLPADLSAVSYFVFAAAAFLPLRRLKCAASFFSLLSGSVYAVTMILFPGEHFGEHTTEFLAGMAMFHHALLLIGGLAMCSLCRPERKKDAPAVLGALALYLAYLGLLWVFDPASASLATAIFGIVDGSLVAGVLGLSVTAGYLALYILAITLVFLALAAAFFALGRRMSGRRRMLSTLIRLPGSFV